MPLGSIKKLLVLGVLWLTVVATAGCDASTSSPGSNTRGEARTEKLKTNLSVEEARQIAQPASATPGLSVDVQAAQNRGVGNENFSEDLEPAKGLTTNRLFDTAAGSDDERFERLEAAMQKLRDDFDSVSPAINRLIAIEREIQTLVDQLQVLVENDGGQGVAAQIPPVSTALVEEEFPSDPAAASQSPPVPLAAPLPFPSPPAQEQPEQAAPAQATPAATPAVQETVPAPVQTANPAPASAPAPQAQKPSGATLAAIRVADHAGSTRIVFEASQNLSYGADVDPEKILIVTFREGVANANLSSASTKSKLVKSVDVTPQGAGGFIVAMPLSKMTKILKQGVLKPDATNRNYRIYIDLAP